MRRRRYDLADDEDPYGPGSDLVLSLFAMAMLLVALIGSGDALVKSDPPAATAQEGTGTASQVILLLRQNQGLRDENDVLKQHLSTNGAAQATQTNGDLRRAEILLAESRKREEEAKANAAALAAKADETAQTNRDLLALLKKQQAIAIDRITETKLNRGLILVHLTEEAGRALFECPEQRNRDDDWTCLVSPSSDLKAAVQNALRSRAGDIATAKINSLSIEVNNSIEPVTSPSRSSEGSLELSTARASSIAEMLAAKGVPYVCMVATGFGRSRAAGVRDQLATEGNAALTRMDDILESAPSRDQRIKAADRVVTIRGFVDDTSPCVADILASKLKTIID